MILLLILNYKFTYFNLSKFLTKQKKLKISVVKRSNQKRTKLSRQGKLKTRRHKLAKKQIHKKVLPHTESVEEEESDHGEDLMGMIEEEDLDFLKKAISNKSYNLLKQIHLNGYNYCNN